MNNLKVQNPPSIPSHLSVFGYEENENGQLVKQKSNQIGFTGIKADKVGPGDYEVLNAKNIVHKTVTGVVTWKKPPLRPEPGSNEKEKHKTEDMPGPGQYNLEANRPQKQLSSMFVSKVPRSTSSVANRRAQSRQMSRGGAQSQKPGTQGGRRALQPASQTGQDLDIFEDDDDEGAPGPGAYYNPKSMSSFQVNKKPEKLQFFGSTVDRFAPSKPTSASEMHTNIGPGSYQVSNLINFHKKANNTVFSAFNCTRGRFVEHECKETTPGPGQYNFIPLAEQLAQKPATKHSMFGSKSNRFVEKVDSNPGPGHYSQSQLAAAQKKKVSSMNNLQTIKQPVMPATTGNKGSQSYIQQKQQALKEASKNYLNQIQYDAKTNTIGDNLRKHTDKGNPILATLKAKTGINSQIGFGSRVPHGNGKPKKDASENYLGPGYYEQKGTFEQKSRL